MTEERLVSVIQNQSGFLFFLLLPVVPKRMLFRLHKAAVAVDGAGVQRHLKLSKLFVRKRDVGGTEVLTNSFQILGAGDRYHIGILVQHPGQRNLRKKGCVPSALTQNVKDLLASREIENILDNTDFMILLSQAQSDRTILAKQLGISEHQLSYITHSNSGEGLLFYGNVTIPFVDRFPRGEIYDLLTTRPEDMKNETKNE